jgi:hypothetical protein
MHIFLCKRFYYEKFWKSFGFFRQTLDWVIGKLLLGEFQNVLEFLISFTNLRIYLEIFFNQIFVIRNSFFESFTIFIIDWNTWHKIFVSIFFWGRTLTLKRYFLALFFFPINFFFKLQFLKLKSFFLFRSHFGKINIHFQRRERLLEQRIQILFWILDFNIKLKIFRSMSKWFWIRKIFKLNLIVVHSGTSWKNSFKLNLLRLKLFIIILNLEIKSTYHRKRIIRSDWQRMKIWISHYTNTESINQVDITFFICFRLWDFFFFLVFHLNFD